MCSRMKSSSLVASTSNWSENGSELPLMRPCWHFFILGRGALLTARYSERRGKVPSDVQRGVAVANSRAAALFVLMSIGFGQVDLNQTTVKHVNHTSCSTHFQSGSSVGVGGRGPALHGARVASTCNSVNFIFNQCLVHSARSCSRFHTAPYLPLPEAAQRELQKELTLDRPRRRKGSPSSKLSRGEGCKHARGLI